MLVLLQFLFLCLCLVGEAFFAGMETGVISIHRMRLRHFVRRGARGARLLQEYLHDYDRLLGTTLVGTNVCVVVVSVVAASAAVQVLGHWGEACATAVVAVVVLVFGEYLPKAWFHSRPLERCARFVGALRIAELVLKPVASAVVWLTRWLVPGPEESFSKPAPFVTREDLKLLAREGEKDGVLSARERVMIHRVIELSGKRAAEIMTPRNEITLVHSDTTIRDFFETARKSNFTRMPVIDGSSGDFIGVINVFYVLSSAHKDMDQLVAEHVRRPLFVPEGMPVDDILPLLRRVRQPMGLVKNEAGDVTGLITTEDILEEIVGEL